MSIQRRNNVQVYGDGSVTIVFAHGFGCDQSMWRYLVPSFKDRFRVVTFDLVGSGGSDLSAYDQQKYGTLHGYADDLIEIINEFSVGPVVFVGHSVSTMIGLLATIKAPERFIAQIMVSPSPCFINDRDYVGGFTHSEIGEILETMESNYLGWSSTIAPMIMGAPQQPELSTELTSRFCRNDPNIAEHFAQVTFLSDHRADLPKSSIPALILQCSDDLIAPRSVGEFIHQQMPYSVLRIINNVGHCPHMSAASDSFDAMSEFLSKTLL